TGCCASARWTEARAKPTSKTTMAFVAIPACLLRFIASCPGPFFLPLAHPMWHSWHRVTLRQREATHDPNQIGRTPCNHRFLILGTPSHGLEHTRPHASDHC